MEISPEDSALIKDLINDTKAIGKLDMSFMIKPRELYGVLDYISMLRIFPALRLMRKWNQVTVGEVLSNSYPCIYPQNS
jgi:hypothetical protein